MNGSYADDADLRAGMLRVVYRRRRGLRLHWRTCVAETAAGRQVVGALMHSMEGLETLYCDCAGCAGLRMWVMGEGCFGIKCGDGKRLRTLSEGI